MRKHLRYALRSAIVEVLAEEREKLHWSRRELSRRLGTYETFINDVETYQHALKAEEFVMIALAMERTPTKLLLRAIRKARKAEKT